jgi:hypothetical protein
MFNYQPISYYVYCARPAWWCVMDVYYKMTINYNTILLKIYILINTPYLENHARKFGLDSG